MSAMIGVILGAYLLMSAGEEKQRGEGGWRTVFWIVLLIAGVITQISLYGEGLVTGREEREDLTARCLDALDDANAIKLPTDLPKSD